MMSQPLYPARRARALLIDAEDDARRSLHLLLNGCGFDVRAFSRIASALEEQNAREAGVILIAHCLPETDGPSLLSLFRDHGWTGRAILIASSSHDEFDETARRAGFSAVIRKPVGRFDLLRALAH